MCDESIEYALPSLYLARVFYSHGMLDDMISAGLAQVDEDYTYWILELFSIAADAVWIDYIEAYNANKYFFSNECMTEYYRLCRIYGRMHGIKPKKNPYVKAAYKFVEEQMLLGYRYGTGGGYAWQLTAKTGGKSASGLVVGTDDYFNSELELIDAMLNIREWYTIAAANLAGVIEEERRKAKELKTEGALEVKAA